MLYNEHLLYLLKNGYKIIELKVGLCLCFRGNNITDTKEIKKLAVIPMMRALVLSGE